MMVRFLGWGLAAGLIWSLYEVALLLVFGFDAYVAGESNNALNLASAGLLNYSLLALVLGAVAYVYYLAARLLQRKKQIRAGTFFVSAFTISLLVLWAGIFVNRNALARISVLHPWSLLVSVGIVIAGFVLCLVLYRALSKLGVGDVIVVFRRKWFKPAFVGLPTVVIMLIALINPQPASQADMKSAAAFADKSERSAEDDSASATMRAQNGANGHEGRINIILLTIETLRADHLNVYGYDKKLHTPNIDALSRDGVTFMHNIAQSSWTKPSMVSIMSSLYPQQHGINNLTVDIEDTLLTLPMLLRDQGYQTISLVTNGLAKSDAFQFDETFYHEINALFDSPAVVSPFSYQPFLLKRLIGEVPLHNSPVVFPDEMVSDWYIDAEKVNYFLKRWLAENHDQPIFLHLHLFEPHEPYLDHPYNQIQFNLRAGWNRERLEYYYDREIEYLDQQIGVLQQLLAEAGMADNSLIIFTSDHGEEFLDHGGWGHGKTLFEEAIHVPLIFTFPDRRHAGQQIDARVANIDIAPTVLEWVGLEAPAQFQGRSLIDLMAGAEQPERALISHVQNPTFESTALYKGDYKYIRTEGFHEKQYLFELSADPREKNNLATERPEIMAELEADLLAFTQHFENTQLKRKTIELTEEQKKRLRALGYLK